MSRKKESVSPVIRKILSSIISSLLFLLIAVGVFFTGVRCCILTLRGGQMESPLKEYFHSLILETS